jgi:hypothetical protein
MAGEVSALQRVPPLWRISVNISSHAVANETPSVIAARVGQIRQNSFSAMVLRYLLEI